MKQDLFFPINSVVDPGGEGCFTVVENRNKGKC